MGQEVKIDINPVANPTNSVKAAFVPQTMTVMCGDLVFWANNDTQYVHQPMPVNGAPNSWVKGPIAVRQDDEPGTSNTLSFDPGTNKDGVPYFCAIHVAETGTIIVLNNVNINTVAGAQPTSPQASFAPGKLNLAVNEGFIWTNNDVKAHWPAPSVAQKTAWLQEAIQPGQKSKTVSFAQSNPGIAYVCAIPGHEKEQGTIVIK
jgi:plastocyanin